MKTKVCEVRHIFWYHILQLWKSKRWALTMILGGVLMFLLTEKIVDFSEQENTCLQVFEPFVWVLDEKESLLLSSILLIFLFIDLPYTDGSVPFFLSRTSRVSWMVGQLLYVGVCTAGYAVYIACIGCIFSCRNAFVGNKWSETAAMLGFSEYSTLLEIPAQLKTMQIVTPYRCLATILVLLFLYTFMSVLCMIYFSYRVSKLGGLVSVIVFHVLSFLINPEFLSAIMKWDWRQNYKSHQICAWISPLSHATFHMHSFGFDALPRVITSVGYFAFGCVIFFCLILHEMKRHSFYFKGTEEI